MRMSATICRARTHSLYHRTHCAAPRLAIACGMGKDGYDQWAGAACLRLQEACLSLERLDGKDVRVLLIWILAGLHRRGRRLQIFFPGVSGSLGRFQSASRGRPGTGQAICRGARRAARRIRFEHRLRCGRHGEDLPRTRSRPGQRQPDDARHPAHLVLADALFPPAAKGRIRRARRSRRRDCRIFARAGGNRAGGPPGARRRAIRCRNLPARYPASGSFALRVPRGRSEFHRAAQPARLELFVGTPRLPRQGRAVPAERDARRGPRRRLQRIPESSRGLGARLHSGCANRTICSSTSR